MKCSICNCDIIGLYYQDYWGNKVCSTHIDNNEVTFCSSCGSYTQVKNTISDGRALCPYCIQRIVSNPYQTDKIKQYVIKQFNHVGIHILNIETIEIVIATPHEIANIRHETVNFQNKGITLTQKINTIGGKLFGTKDRMYHKVYILSGLPRIEFAGTLAHEFLHIWQHENNIELPPNKCEGLCNMGSYMIYEDMAAQKGEYYIKCLLENQDPIYGDGFRLIYSIYEQCGLEKLFEKAINNTL